MLASSAIDVGKHAEKPGFLLPFSAIFIANPGMQQRPLGAPRWNATGARKNIAPMRLCY